MSSVRTPATLFAVALMWFTGCGDEGGISDSTSATTGAPNAADDERAGRTDASCDASSPVVPGEYELRHTFGGVEQSYVAVVPETYDPKTPAHVYIVVPGGSGSAQAARAGWGPNLAGVDAIVVFADVGNPATRTVPMIRALIDDVADRHCVDRSRVYATGGSASAGFTARLMADASDVIAAFAPGIGTFGTTGLDPIGPVPLIAWSGDLDRAQVERSVAEWAIANGCATEPTSSDLGSGIVHHHYEDCAASTEFYDFVGMGHQVPSHDCSGVGPQYCAEYEEFDFWKDVGSFFDAHPLPAP